MKKLHILFMTVCCVAAMVSCGKTETETPIKPETEPEQKEEKEEEEATKVVLYGSLGETTKTYLSPRSDDEGNPEAWFDVYWEKNDEIAICKDNNNQHAVYWTQEDSGKNMVRFEKKSGTDLNVGESFYALYPASLVDNAGALLWPSEQRYQEISASPTGAAGNNPMWATATVAADQTKMQFYNLGGVIRFKLSKPTAEFKVVKAMISADQPMSGEFRLDDITDITAKKATITKAGPGITITPENPVTISETGEASFYFAVPAGEYTGVQITLVGDTGEKVTAKLGAGKYLVVKRAEVVRLKAEGITPSIEGSNCFIGEGNVPIVITAMGNAFDGTTALDGNEAKAVWKPLYGNADACEVVWETVNTVDTPNPGTIIKSATYSENGVLTVVPTGTPGNALVAVKKNDVIVWSYHIWVPGTPINNVSITNSTGNFVFLDRNLGALRVADSNLSGSGSIGLSYQWGRKDPLLGIAKFGGSELMNKNKKANITRTLLASIQNPDCIIGTGSNIRWTSENLSNLWGWTTGEDLKEATQNKKSIYDPCPAGYRVPGDSEYVNALGNGTNSSFPRTLINNVFQFENYPGLTFPNISAIYPSGQYQTTVSIIPWINYDSVRFIWTAVQRKQGGEVAWQLHLQKNSDSGTHVGNQSTTTGGDGQYEVRATNVRCIRDMQSTDNGYSIAELNQEKINFFD